MINEMLDKLKSQVRQSIALQQQGEIFKAFLGYELAFEALSYYDDLGYTQQTESIRNVALAAQPTPEMTLYCHGLILYYRKQYPAALETICSALQLCPNSPELQLLKGKTQVALGDFKNAYETCLQMQDAGDLSFFLAAEREMPGEDYYHWLQLFHFWLAPATYVEIGLGHGRSLALAGPKTRAIGIDPYQGFWERLNYVSPHTPATLFPLASDDFFVQHDLTNVLGQSTFDLAFIDGLHLFEQVLKDFINLERYARKDSVVLIHDCLPIAPVVAKRERCTGFWTGDVWRIIPCLKTFRPDLEIFTIPTKPSGLAVVSGLDSESTVLAENYQAIVDYYLGLNLPESTNDRFRLLNVKLDGCDGIAAKFARQ
ncbi:MAG: class I SAM-dependent methyltransferase [Geobacteraceae bacterium]|nr:class I SAM-dependent methyltransferase [Geobacteraceae bacterium]